MHGCICRSDPGLKREVLGSRSKEKVVTRIFIKTFRQWPQSHTEYDSVQSRTKACDVLPFFIAQLHPELHEYFKCMEFPTPHAVTLRSRRLIFITLIQL